MNTTEVIALLRDNQDERGIKHWNNGAAGDSGLRSFGIGLTRLRKMAKQIGRDAELAARLWSSEYYDARVISLLIDDPKTITMEQAERQVEELSGGMLSHVFASCDATLAKAPFVRDLADKWMGSSDPVRRCCGYGLLYEVSKSNKKSAPEESWFLSWVAHIDDNWRQEGTSVLLAMGTALMGAGKRSKALNAAALKVARDIGPIVFDETGKCDPMDFEKHLTSEYIKKRLGLA